MATISIQKSKIKKEGGVVVLSLKEYQKLYERAVPTYYLKGKAAKKLDELVEEGLREYRAGKTRAITSLADLD
ncbi:hypothetical protein HYR65_03345 [Candidatus Azambacteria bacterium]|nr:hypothetical protein [Candidatus Azambacteria bacterium]